MGEEINVEIGNGKPMEKLSRKAQWNNDISHVCIISSRMYGISVSYITTHSVLS